MPRSDIPMKNPDGYMDLTAHEALSNIMNDIDEDSDVRNNKLMKAVRLLIDLAGFEPIERIAVKDKKTGRIYR